NTPYTPNISTLQLAVYNLLRAKNHYCTRKQIKKNNVTMIDDITDYVNIYKSSAHLIRLKALLFHSTPQTTHYFSYSCG
ncbi:hypothetical protein, partial [Pedobacter antarcticus]|uniref:hypothetical protein n=1 Tax=Pedobacter antarcticus TaxID=34086 RepID=UPI00292EF79F